MPNDYGYINSPAPRRNPAAPTSPALPAVAINPPAPAVGTQVQRSGNTVAFAPVGGTGSGVVSSSDTSGMDRVEQGLRETPMMRQAQPQIQASMPVMPVAVAQPASVPAPMAMPALPKTSRTRSDLMSFGEIGQAKRDARMAQAVYQAQMNAYQNDRNNAAAIQREQMQNEGANYRAGLNETGAMQRQVLHNQGASDVAQKTADSEMARAIAKGSMDRSLKEFEYANDPSKVPKVVHLKTFDDQGIQNGEQLYQQDRDGLRKVDVNSGLPQMRPMEQDYAKYLKALKPDQKRMSFEDFSARMTEAGK